MKRSIFVIAVLLLALTLQISDANAVYRNRTLYPGDDNVITIIRDNPVSNPVNVTLWTNSESAVQMSGRSQLGYQGTIVLDTGWIFGGDDGGVWDNLPDYMLRNCYWISLKDENNQPGGCIVYKFDY